jgi:flagellar assembly protein FliH
MSSNRWQPIIESAPALAAPRAARILAPDTAAAAEPMLWRDIAMHAARPVAQHSAPAPDLTAQIDSLRAQCEQRVREAHTAGAREGEAAAKNRAAAEVQGTVDKLAQSIADLAQLRPRLRKQAEWDAVKLALAIAKRVLRREIAVDPDAIRGLVLAALEKLQAQEIYRVRSNPAHTAPVTAAIRASAPQIQIEIIGDASLPPGGVVFETNQGNLDASIDSQLAEIERGLADHLRRRS